MIAGKWNKNDSFVGRCSFGDSSKNAQSAGNISNDKFYGSLSPKKEPETTFEVLMTTNPDALKWVKLNGWTNTQEQVSPNHLIFCGWNYSGQATFVARRKVGQDSCCGDYSDNGSFVHWCAPGGGEGKTSQVEVLCIKPHVSEM